MELASQWGVNIPELAYYLIIGGILDCAASLWIQELSTVKLTSVSMFISDKLIFSAIYAHPAHWHLSELYLYLRGVEHSVCLEQISDSEKLQISTIQETQVRSCDKNPWSMQSWAHRQWQRQPLKAVSRWYAWYSTLLPHVNACEILGAWPGATIICRLFIDVQNVSSKPIY